MDEEERRRRKREWAREYRRNNRDRVDASKQRYRERDPKAFMAMRRAASARYSEKNREAIRVKAREVHEQLKAEAVAAYGGRCACPGCHVHHAELMTIDHINGDGGEHRRQLGRSSRDFYRWLKKQGYPPGFQALCGSCNLAKSDRPECPLVGQDH